MTDSLFDQFHATFKGDIITPSDEGHERAIDRWAKNAVRRARIVAYVKDAEDVSTAIKFAKVSELPLAVHGGGHSPNGASSSEDGLVIDLARYCKGVRVDAEKRIAYVGGGATWADVNSETMKYGLAMTGGTVGSTGVGGLTLGGGYGWLTPMHGLTIDHLLQVTITSADAITRTANATENSDLFWAVRGGGMNFGIVTEFVFKLHPQPNTVFAGPVVYTEDKLDVIAQTIEKWYPTAGPKEAIHCMMTRQEGMPVIVLLIFYNGPEAEARELYKAFSDIGPIADARTEASYDEWSLFLDASLVTGKCYWNRGFLSDHALKVLTRETFEKVMQLSEPGSKFSIFMTFEFLPMNKVTAVPSTAMAFPRNKMGNGVAVVVWDDNEVELEVQAKQIVADMTDLVKASDHGKQYGNFSADTEDLPTIQGVAKVARAQELFGDNYPRLQQLKRQYDPDMIFNKWYCIRPAVA